MTNAINANPHRKALAYIESNQKPGILSRIISLIIEIIKKICGLFQFLNQDPYELEERQVQAFRKIQLDSYIKPIGPPPKTPFKKRPISEQNFKDRIIKSHVLQPKVIKSEYEGREFPIALQNMRETLASIVSDAVDCLQETKLLPLLENRSKYVEKALKMIKDTSTIMVTIAFQLKAPIFDMLRQNQITFCDNPAFDVSSKKALDWLVEDDNINYKNEVHEALAALFEDKQSKEYCESVINWAFNPKRTNQLQREQYEPIYQQCVTILINKKLDALCQDLNKRLIDNLPNLIHTFIKVNSAILIEELSGRLADLLSQMNITDIIVNLTKVAKKHTDMYVLAQELVAEEYDGNLNSNDRILRPDIEDEYIKACAKKFATLEEAHPLLHDIVRVPEGKDHITWFVSEGYEIRENSFEQLFITNVCETLINTLFPKIMEEKDGKIANINALKHLWERVVVPSEIKSVVTEVETFLQRFLPEDFTFAKDARVMLNNAAEQCIIAAATAQLTEFLSGKLFILFKSLITPEEFSHLINSYIAPVIEEQCINLFTRVALKESLDSYAQFLGKLRTEKKQLLCNLSGIKQYIHDKLIKHQFSKNEPNLDQICDLICGDLKSALFTERNLKSPLEFVAAAISGGGNAYHEIAEKVIVPDLDGIQYFIKQTYEQACNIQEIENKFAEELYILFDSKATQFKTVSGPIPKELFIERIAMPMIVEFEEVLTNKDFDKDDVVAAISKYLEGEPVKEGDNSYSQTIINLFFNIGEFGGNVSRSLVQALSPQINSSIEKGLSRFKKDDYLLIAMIANKLKSKFSSKEAIKEAFFLSGKEKVEQADLSDSINRISAIVYDLLYPISNGSATQWFKGWIASPFLGNDSSYINNSIRRIFNRLFQNPLLNADLVFKTRDVLFSALLTASLKIKKESAPYGIPNENLEKLENSLSGSSLI